MGGIASRRKPPNASGPQYSATGGGQPPYSIARPGNQMYAGASPFSAKQQRDLEQATRTIQNLQQQVASIQRGGAGGSPPLPYFPPYDGPPIINQQSSYRPPSPLLQQLTGQGSYNPGGYRDSDFVAVANIAGLNPVDIALLHREYVGLTRGGTNKIDRVVFRQLLRDVMIEANHESIDRAIENMFISIDRNRDGFIDFPEFVGAFRDVLKGSTPGAQNYLPQSTGFADTLNEQLRANVIGPNISSAPMTYIRSASPAGQSLSFVPNSIQQAPLVYGGAGAGPLVISLDANQSPYIVNNQGQPLTMQCVALPSM